MSDLFSGKLTQLLKIARERNKQAFIDPAMMGGGGAPPMDPAMGGGGAPPMDPAMMGGAPPMDPSMMGGAPPMDPSMMGMDPSMMGMDPSMMGGAPPSPGGGSEDIRAIIKEELAASGLTGAGGATETPAGKIKPKIDVNVELLQIKKMLARLADAMGVNIPAAEMVATEDDLTEMANAGAAGGGMTPGAIPSIEAIGGAFPEPKAAGIGANLETLSDRASAMAYVMSRQSA
jgi:hypothetical protein